MQREFKLNVFELFAAFPAAVKNGKIVEICINLTPNFLFFRSRNEKFYTCCDEPYLDISKLIPLPLPKRCVIQ